MVRDDEPRERPVTEEPPTGGSLLQPWLRDILRCPRCRCELADGTGEGGQPQLWCTGTAGPDGACGLRYRIEEGIPVLLVDEAEDPRGVLR